MIQNAATMSHDPKRPAFGRPGPCPELSLEQVRTYPLVGRRNIASSTNFATPVGAAATVGELVASLPDIYAGKDLKDLVGAIVGSRAAGKPVFMGLGAHVIKVGLSGLVIDLLDRGVLCGLCMHGAGAVHDLELAMIGETSEDVAASISDGSFGMAAETAARYGEAARLAVAEGTGLGSALGRLISRSGFACSHLSLLAACHRLGLPCPVLVAIGTDIVHMHPVVDPAALGESSHRDFRLLCGMASRLAGGVWLNVGSAVILPEAFLKAVNVARNLGHDVTGVTTANLDMLRHYRPRVNVLERPAERGIQITGHHEIMLPLLRAAILSAMAEKGFSL